MALLLRIFGIIFPVFAVAGIGVLYGMRHRPDMAVVNRLNMEVFAPALVFWALADKPFDLAANLGLAFGGAAVVLGSGLLLWPLARLLGLDVKTFLPPMMFNNSGNMGIPLALFAFGEPALQAAVVLFVVEMVLHFTLGFYILDHTTRFSRLLRMPMILATLAGLGCGIAGLRLPGPLAETVRLLGQVSVPLLLFSLGVRLREVDLRDWRTGVLGAVLCPLSGLAMALALLPLLALDELQVAQLLLFGALPPAVLNVLVAEQYRQEPERVASIVMIGNLGALVTLPLVLFFVLPGA
ncbi:hypothetical protein EV699_1307 [Plasticicumulans lactativorans]|uniref:Permease n=1 Tax=Plasticicumulans lactativorans TaxID=1133106 RepID=A0A4R2KRQ8_9GAMM|nr:AEC family transporter [Plasticicumulans lactativorans]TCO76384.1 hypothetical protein EV699_1307 [Plasticicumulans lactativorans]